MVVRIEQGDFGAATADDELVNLAEALAEARAALKAWREREDDLKSQILHKMAGAELAIKGSRGVCRITTVYPKPRFDASAFASDYPDLHDTYKREVDPYQKVEV